MKNFLSRLLLLLLIFSFSYGTAAYANEQQQSESEPILFITEKGDSANSSLRYSLISNLGISLKINNRIADIYTECGTYENTNITLTTELQRYGNGSWSTIKTYTDSTSNGTFCYCSKSYAVTMGYEYRIKLTATVKNGSFTESDTKYSSEVTCYNLLSEK